MYTVLLLLEITEISWQEKSRNLFTSGQVCDAYTVQDIRISAVICISPQIRIKGIPCRARY
jgi:hypothetical protein